MKDWTIKVKDVSKFFQIPHERINTLRGAFVNAFRKTTFEKFKALDKVSFEIKKGEFFGIIGRNGSGKSTLLKILAGIYTPDEGKVLINGKISPFLELGIGFNPDLSGRENIYLNGIVLGLTKKEIDCRFDDIVKFSELERFIDQKIKNYSSGMQVRLAFSVAIHAKRDILLMDEVLAVGDANFQSKCLEEFNKNREMGRTVVLVTHNIGIIQRYCQRALLLKDGKVLKIGKANEVGDDYILENISDEEARVRNEETKFKQEQSSTESSVKKEKIESEESKRGNFSSNGYLDSKNKPVQITKVEVLDREKKRRNNFCSGEDLFVFLEIKKNKEVNDLSVRISLETIDGFYLLGYDTITDNFRIENNKKRIYLKFKKIPLLEGHYFVNASCFMKNGTMPIDFKKRCVNFKIYSNTKEQNYKGLLNIKHQWE